MSLLPNEAASTSSGAISSAASPSSSLSTWAHSTATAAAAAPSPSAAASSSASLSAVSYPLPPRVPWRGDDWLLLESDSRELRLDLTLQTGQAFGWVRIDQQASTTSVKEEETKQESKAGAAKGGRKRARSSRQAASEPDAAAASPSPATNSAIEATSAASTILPVAPASNSPCASELLGALESGVKLEPMDEDSATARMSDVPAAAASSPCPFSPSDLEYACVLFGGALVGLRQAASDGSVWYTLHASAPPQAGAAPLTAEQLDARLRDYFYLPPRVDSALLQPSGLLPHAPSPHVHAQFSLVRLYDRWSGNNGSNARFRSLTRVFPGVRLMRADPLECVFSFLCSSNNHIARITAMLQRLRAEKGVEVLQGLSEEKRTKLGTERRWFAFPTLPALCQLTEPQLREWGFGYRAKYLVGSASLLHSRGGERWLHSLRSLSRPDAERSLAELPGVGPKVAGCVALFSLDQLECVPVDTHVWQLAQRDYSTHAAAKGLGLGKIKQFNTRVGEQVANLMRSIFEPHAGWAHCILFLAELKQYAAMLRAAGVEMPTQESKEEAEDEQQQEATAAATMDKANSKPSKSVGSKAKKIKVEAASSPPPSLDDGSARIKAEEEEDAKQLLQQPTHAKPAAAATSAASLSLSHVFTQRKAK